MTKYFVNKAVKKFIVSYTADKVGGKRHCINGGIVGILSKLYTVQIPLIPLLGIHHQDTLAKV